MATRQIHKRWQEVVKGHRRRDPARRCLLWCCNHQRHATRRLEEVHLVPEAALAQHVAMIRTQDDVSSPVKIALLECFQELAEFVVEVTDIGKACMPRIADLRISNCEFPVVDGIEEALRMWILPFIRNSRNARHRYLGVLVTIPVFAAGDIRIVGMRKTRRQTKRTRILATRVLEQFQASLMRHLIVKFQLIGDFGDSCLSDGAQIVIPPIDAFARPIPVGCPAKIRWIDVRGQTFLETVQLIRAHKMHLAGERSLIPEYAQVVCEAGNGRPELGRVVENASA